MAVSSVRHLALVASLVATLGAVATYHEDALVSTALWATDADASQPPSTQFSIQSPQNPVTTAHHHRFGSMPTTGLGIADLFANDISAEEILDFTGSLSALQVSRRQAYYATLVRLGVPRECDLRAWDVLTVERA